MKITVEWVLRMRRNDSGRQGELGWRVDLGHDDVNRAGGDPFLSLSFCLTSLLPSLTSREEGCLEEWKVYMAGKEREM